MYGQYADMAGLEPDERGAGWNYYNENDRFAAQWLRELIRDELIPNGVVDERTILDVSPAEVRGFAHCHFFAGIAGWSEALRLAQWPKDREVWTASVPCQPLSVAGKQRGDADTRHLWPTFYNLVAECRPSTIFGEQVASHLGREWLCGVRADLEDIGYAIGIADLPASGVSAPHLRQRLYWVGHSDEPRPQGRSIDAGECSDQLSPWASGKFVACEDGKKRRVKSSILPVVDGFPNRVGVLRGAGNAIVPQVAAAFIEASL